MHEYLYMTVSIIHIFLKISMVICCLIITYPCINSRILQPQKARAEETSLFFTSPFAFTWYVVKTDNVVSWRTQRFKTHFCPEGVSEAGFPSKQTSGHLDVPDIECCPFPLRPLALSDLGVLMAWLSGFKVIIGHISHSSD